MKTVDFTKMVASGNDFVVLEKEKLSAIRHPCLASSPLGARLSALASRRSRGKPREAEGRQALSAIAKQVCHRRYGAGADGLLLLEGSKIADVKMRIFNADGSEAQMCGNGARCVALWAKSKCKMQNAKLKIETRAGIIESEVNKNNVRIKLTEPKNIKLDMPLKVNNRNVKVNFINTGVPHAVIFVEGVDDIDIANLGRQIRYHKSFAPRGANVDFVEVLSKGSIRVRTYERGVEDETLACGTGAAASALLSAIRYPCLAGRQALSAKQISVHTQSKELLKVYFERIGDNFKNVWLEGKVRIVYKGVYYV